MKAILNKTDRELLSYILDEDDYAYVLGLIASAYYQGRRVGWNDCYNNITKEEH